MMSRRRDTLKKLAKSEGAQREQLRVECNDLEERIRAERWRLVNQGIIEEINKIDEGGGIESGAFWEFKKRMEGKKNKEQASAVIGKDKTLKTTTEEIREEFRQFYSELFKQESITNKISERLVDTRIHKIEKLARKNRQRKKHYTEVFKNEVEDHQKAEE